MNNKEFKDKMPLFKQEKEIALRKVFKDIIRQFLDSDYDIENYYNTRDIDIDRVVNRLLKEVSIRVYIKGENK